ncbi:unnamed protein product [Protopolystoma xenopodis]|uniref:Uncharacterized protein n=1 Tax=Protopolystoma xenopodis TaxID=117903 RepID=A0A3S5B8C3_9PLAT|nr:unnamed protein product [Protopolystoma xenopodis]
MARLIDEANVPSPRSEAGNYDDDLTTQSSYHLEVRRLVQIGRRLRPSSSLYRRQGRKVKLAYDHLMRPRLTTGQAVQCQCISCQRVGMATDIEITFIGWGYAGRMGDLERMQAIGKLANRVSRKDFRCESLLNPPIKVVRHFHVCVCVCVCAYGILLRDGRRSGAKGTLRNQRDVRILCASTRFSRKYKHTYRQAYNVNPPLPVSMSTCAHVSVSAGTHVRLPYHLLACTNAAVSASSLSYRCSSFASICSPVCEHVCVCVCVFLSACLHSSLQLEPQIRLLPPFRPSLFTLHSAHSTPTPTHSSDLGSCINGGWFVLKARCDLAFV